MNSSRRRGSARRFVTICATALVAGAVVGFIGGAFRWCLQAADRWRGVLIDWAHLLPGPGWLVPVAVVALAAGLAALVVRWEPYAAGSGIPHVEAIFRGDVRLPLIRILPAKFIGGVLAIGSGLVLGREGPTVHMGAAVGSEAARRARLPETEIRMLQTALGGAGLAVAFNAPIAGVLFVVEEVTKSFRLQAVLATLFASAAAVGCAQLVLGDHPDFTVGTLVPPALAWLPVFVVFGLLTGCLGVGYNRLVLWFLDHVTGFRRIPPVAKAAAIGTVVGLVMVALPLGVGGGDDLTQMILGGHHMLIPAVAGYLAVRFLAGPLSYAAAVPGGLFAPLLTIGALWGVLFVAGIDVLAAGRAADLTVPMALVGMAAFFGATVRAPVTGLMVVIEMTATTSVAVPMLAGTASAVLAAQLLGSSPIYDSLGERLPRDGLRPNDPPSPR